MSMVVHVVRMFAAEGTESQMNMDKDFSSTHQFSSQTILAALRDALAELYPIDQDARRFIDDAGLNIIQVTTSPLAQTNWHNNLIEAIRQESLDSLL